MGIETQHLHAVEIESLVAREFEGILVERQSTQNLQVGGVVYLVIWFGCKKAWGLERLRE